MAQAEMFGVCGKMTAQSGKRDEVVELIKESVRVGGDASGLVSYSVIATLDEPDTIWVTELWTDKAAHDTMTRSEPVRAVSQRLVALLVEPPTGSYGHVLHASGMSAR
ncbi:MAG TPA: antibiotic biosynthesis monooxygenase [Mycobacterium sp.]|jgi:quinol monooxygenase YgiN|nr:antibiotic biosynthesis monooxygenase [Mycobacterium sp.]